MYNIELINTLKLSSNPKRVLFLFEGKFLDIDSFHFSDDLIIKLSDTEILLDEYMQLTK